MVLAFAPGAVDNATHTDGIGGGEGADWPRSPGMNRQLRWQVKKWAEHPNHQQPNCNANTACHNGTQYLILTIDKIWVVN